MDYDLFKPQPIEVLNAIWAQSKGRQIYLPTLLRSTDTWMEGPAWLPPNVGSSFFDRPDEVDYYFTPLKFNGKRRRQFIGNPGVIFADLDGDHREDYDDMPPSIAIATSPGHYHAYWFLDTPAPADLWEQYAKGWTQEIGGDPAGWDITQVLRVPGTINHKYGNEVQIVSFRPERTYPLYAFPKATMRPVLERRARPPRSVSLRGTLIEDGFADDLLPLTARYWLTVTPEELRALGKIDRSAIMWQTEKALISSGYTIEETYQLMYFTAINKWVDEPEKLWAEIIKAAS